MTDPADTPRFKLRTAAKWVAVGAAICVLVGAVVYWLVVPGIVDKVVRDKLEAAGQTLPVDFKIDRVDTSGISAVSLHDIEIADPDSGRPVIEIGQMAASIDLFDVLTGHRELSALTIDDATLYVRRNADGTTNLDRLLGGQKTPDTPPSPTSSTNKSDTADNPAFLNPFGGQWPDVDVRRARVVLSAASDARQWPVRQVAAETVHVDSQGRSAQLDTVMTVARGQANPRWTMPEAIDIQATLRVPLVESTGKITLDQPLEAIGIGPYPFMRFGIGGVAVEADHTVTLDDLSVGVQGGAAPTRLADIGRVSATFRSLPTAPQDIRLLELRVDAPVVHIDYDEQFGSGLGDLNQLIRAPVAGQIHGHAEDVADAIATDAGLEVDDDTDDGDGLLAKLGQVDWTKFLGEYAPQQVVVKGAAVEISDARPLDLARMDRKLSLEDGRFKFSHRAINGELVFDGGFQARAGGDKSRGTVDAKVRWSYRDSGLDIDANIASLSLPWVAQVFAAGLAKRIDAGTLRADLNATSPAKNHRIDLDGLISIEDGAFDLAPVAEAPIQRLAASYDFEAVYEPDAEIPKPELLDAPAVAAANSSPDADGPGAPAQPDAPSSDDASRSPPEKGRLVVTKGAAKLNGIAVDLRPALYGLDGFARRPARLDLEVDLPSIDVMTLFDAVPNAIKGPLDGTEMRGAFGWNLNLEVPLYDAGDMEWNSQPELTGFELVSMPEQVDVRKLADQFDLTIEDPAIKWTRTVTIPEMKPVSRDWLERHSGLSAEEITRRRKHRQWPPIAPEPAGMTASGNSSPRVPTNGSIPADMHPTPPADDPLALADKPAAFVHQDGVKKEHPYGPYTYVPLEQISPWMVRAAMTTEDNSFFEHHGFNWYALKDSVEDNLEAGRFVRGASTISMQLVKNVFLSRRKVLARKIREVFLVWLMEDVADIPKARLLELYFNIIEYGPGIFGIYDAAVHYFGKRPADLTLTEVAWLVSIVPNPKKYHFYYRRGAISDAWFRHMLRYVAVMHDRGRVTQMEYALAKHQKPAFYKPADGEPMIQTTPQRDQFDQLQEGASQIEIPGLDHLFGP